MHARRVRHHNPPRTPPPRPLVHTQPPDRGYAHNLDTPQNHTEDYQTHRCGRAGHANCARAATSARLAPISVRAEMEERDPPGAVRYVVYGYMWLCVNVQMLTRSLAPVHLLSCAKCEHLGRGLSLV